MTEFSRKTQLLAWLAYLIALPTSWAWLPAMVGDDGKQVAKVAYVAIMLILPGPGTNGPPAFGNIVMALGVIEQDAKVAGWWCWGQ